MSRSYGGAHLQTSRQLEVFEPAINGRDADRTQTHVVNLPGVKDQGSWPVCSAVVAVTLYEQLLLRERNWPWHSVEMGWAWTYLMGLRKLSKDDAHLLNEQLLSGVPLSVAIEALAEHGVIATGSGLPINDPAALQRELAKRRITPVTRLEFPLRTLKILPTVTAIYDAVQAQYAVGFAFAVDATVDEWMQDPAAQNASDNVLRTPPAGAPRLATHSAVITGVNMSARMVTVLNSFGRDFGVFGFFFITFQTLLRPDFANLDFHVLTRAG